MASGAEVYPRVGGGARSERNVQILTTGLSPRGRGSPLPVTAATSNVGSIPAWAGEPPFTQATTSSARVYPRVGGGA